MRRHNKEGHMDMFYSWKSKVREEITMISFIPVSERKRFAETDWSFIARGQAEHFAEEHCQPCSSSSWSSSSSCWYSFIDFELAKMLTAVGKTINGQNNGEWNNFWSRVLKEVAFTFEQLVLSDSGQPIWNTDSFPKSCTPLGHKLLVCS